MIYKNLNEKFEHEGKTFIIGEMVYATESAYYGLVGVIKEIRTDLDQETENSTPEIVCDFYAPVLSNDIDNLKRKLGNTYSLDGIIMAPSMLTPARNSSTAKLDGKIAYLVVEEWNYDGEGFSTEIAAFSNRASALMYFRTMLAKEAQYGIISTFIEDGAVVVDEEDNYYEIYIDGDYLNNHYFIRILEKTLIE